MNLSVNKNRALHDRIVSDVISSNKIANGTVVAIHRSNLSSVFPDKKHMDVYDSEVQTILFLVLDSIVKWEPFATPYYVLVEYNTVYKLTQTGPKIIVPSVVFDNYALIAFDTI
jgi:hypothetical protein